MHSDVTTCAYVSHSIRDVTDTLDNYKYMNTMCERTSYRQTTITLRLTPEPS